MFSNIISKRRKYDCWLSTTWREEGGAFSEIMNLDFMLFPLCDMYTPGTAYSCDQYI